MKLTELAIVVQWFSPQINASLLTWIAKGVQHMYWCCWMQILVVRQLHTQGLIIDGWQYLHIGMFCLVIDYRFKDVQKLDFLRGSDWESIWSQETTYEGGLTELWVANKGCYFKMHKANGEKFGGNERRTCTCACGVSWQRWSISIQTTRNQEKNILWPLRPSVE